MVATAMQLETCRAAAALGPCCSGCPSSITAVALVACVGGTTPKTGGELSQNPFLQVARVLRDHRSFLQVVIRGFL